MNNITKEDEKNWDNLVDTLLDFDSYKKYLERQISIENKFINTIEGSFIKMFKTPNVSPKNIDRKIKEASNEEIDILYNIVVKAREEENTESISNISRLEESLITIGK